jgi:hypothetical protein
MTLLWFSSVSSRNAIPSQRKSLTHGNPVPASHTEKEIAPVKNARHRYFLFVVLTLYGPLAFGQLCVTSVPLGICGPYSYPLVTGSNGTNVNVQNGFWNSANAPTGSSQTMYASDPGNWYVTANFPLGETEIWTYPDSDAIYLSAPPLVSRFTYLYSSFAENMHLNASTDAEAAYDIWFNGYANEVMIWNDVSNRGGPNYYGGCTSKLSAQVVFGGSHGVPKHLWNLAKCGSELVWQLDQPSLLLCSAAHPDPGFPHESIDPGTGSVYGITRGSVDILAMLTWLMNNGYLPADSTIDQLEYGFEIASTGGVNEKFEVSDWSVTEQPGLP